MENNHYALTELAVQINNWDSESSSVEILRDLLLKFGTSKNYEKYGIYITSLGCASKYQDIVNKYSEYPIWACDFDGNCLVGDNFDTENINQIVEYYNKGMVKYDDRR